MFLRARACARVCGSACAGVRLRARACARACVRVLVRVRAYGVRERTGLLLLQIWTLRAMNQYARIKSVAGQ